jgi:hypothetical protein
MLAQSRPSPRPLGPAPRTRCTPPLHACAVPAKAKTYVMATLLLLSMHEPRHAAVVTRAGAIPPLVALLRAGPPRPARLSIEGRGAGGAPAGGAEDGLGLATPEGVAGGVSSRPGSPTREFAAAVIACLSRHKHIQVRARPRQATPGHAGRPPALGQPPSQAGGLAHGRDLMPAGKPGGPLPTPACRLRLPRLPSTAIPPQSSRPRPQPHPPHPHQAEVIQAGGIPALARLLGEGSEDARGYAAEALAQLAAAEAHRGRLTVRAHQVRAGRKE